MKKIALIIVFVLSIIGKIISVEASANSSLSNLDAVYEGGNNDYGSVLAIQRFLLD
ncbi:MAG: hypothetical protein HUJ76_11085 [Parasporobacterium sp.]|nr:hypothetical protein [Parasporobacterium sp.]